MIDNYTFVGIGGTVIGKGINLQTTVASAFRNIVDMTRKVVRQF